MSDWIAEQKREKEWLTSLKAGDEVGIYYSGLGGGRYEFLQIGSESKRFFTVGATKFRKEDGREAGEHRYHSRLVEPTAELKAEVQEKYQIQVLSRKLESVNWRNLPLAILRNVDSLIPVKANGESR